MYRINASWQNWPGAPGVSTFFQDPAVAQPNPAAVAAFFDAVKGIIPVGLTITAPSSGDLVDETDGKLVGTWSTTPAPAAVTGTATGNYAGNAGAVVHWLTSTVAGRRRLRGRTFLVPIAATAYEANGSLSAAAITLIQNAANGLMNATAGHLVVWHRPFKGTPTKPAYAGSKAAVTGTRVPDLSVSLRSRRV